LVGDPDRTASNLKVVCSRQGTGNPSGFDADFVVHGESELLLAAEVNLRRLDGYMTKEKLNVVKLASGKMAQTCAGAAKIVRR
jgi:hypothetical protein